MSAYWVEQGKGQRAYEPCGGLCESLSVLRAAEWRRPMRTPDGFHANTHIKDDTVWKYDPKGPYDVDQMLKDQAGRDEEQLNAELAKIQEKALQQGMRDLEAPKLTPYEGDWVYQRTTKQDPLTIMTIWRKSQIKSWSFKFETMDRLGHEVPGFEVSEAGLKIGTGPKAHLYSLSPDKKTLTCMDCTKPERWLKADPNKDLSDRYYARQMAGNP
ncbi:hypothetical protein [Pseudomonas aeruginosa]|uniref:hypothetical protein n=1 Tax=Pseudomonas aeruginosa TaxID=287 RepID=UPI001CD7367C|nr:hypothetical protein [Pseudomonas aeruginosa]